MGGKIQGVFSGQEANLAIAGQGPVNVSVSIYGPGGAVGYNPPSTATVQYYDPVRGQSVRDTVLTGGGFGPTVVTVTTGSLISNERWMGSITVIPDDTFDGSVVASPVDNWGKSTPGWIARVLGTVNAVDDGISGVYGVPGYYVSIAGSQPAMNGGIATNVTYPPGYLSGLGVDPSKLGNGYEPVYDARGNFVGIDIDGCFPSFTLIQTGLDTWKPISEISVGDVVLAPDPSADLGRGELVPRRVTKVYRNTTTEWIKLSWVENGEAKELFATPGHHFLDEFGQFPPLEDMVTEGRATVVLASGELAEVSAERIVYSAETAHLFEQAHSYGMIAGNAALQPVGMDAWQSYNFEVDHLHTYVAGGVRVHNQSGILGRIGNSIDSAMDRLGVVGDAVGDIIGGSLKAAGEIVNGIIGGVAAVAGGFASGFSKLAQGDIIGAAGDIVRGIGEGVASVVRGIGEAVKDFVGGVRDAVKSVVDTVKGWFDPVVLDLDGDGIELTGLGQTGANYDFDNDGYLEATGWIGGGDGLLAYDVDQDGNIDQARELSLKMWDATATTDFDGLRKHFDSNKDGVFDSRDSEFAKFRIWKDADSDGKVDSGELLTLAQAGIRAIDLKSYTSDFDVEKVKYNFGNTIHGMAEFVRTNGQRGNVADVSFATANFGYKIVQRGGDTIFEFESGSESGFKKLGNGTVNFNLGNDDAIWMAAEGGSGANTLDARQKTIDVMLNGGAGNDKLLGGDGNDVLVGGSGRDQMHGGKGNDAIYVDKSDAWWVGGQKQITGGDGYDRLILSEDAGFSTSNLAAYGFEAFEGGNSANHVTALGDDINFYLNGNGGNDRLTTAGGDDVLLGGAGADVLTGNAGKDRLFGEDGNDTLHGGDGEDVLVGGKGNDVLRGGGGDDIYFYDRGDGADHILDYATGTYQERYNYYESVKHGSGKRAKYVNELRSGYRSKTGEIDGGIDTLQFGAAIDLSDIILTRSGANMIVRLRDDANANAFEAGDQITIQDWSDQDNRIETFAFADGTKLDFSQIMYGQYGMGGHDTLNGTNSGDFQNGGNGNDRIYGKDGNDVATGGAGNDYIDGGNGKDFLFADEGNDNVRGGNGNDYLIGGAGNDQLHGQNGNDVLSGEDGSDRLYGGNGDDLILGGAGADYLYGGGGNDTYIYFRGDGKDLIHDHYTEMESYQQATGRMVYQRSGKSGRWVAETRTAKRSVQRDGGEDVLQFGYTIALEDLFITNAGNDLKVGIRDLDDPNKGLNALDDVVTIKDWSNEMNRVEGFEFADGLVLDMSDITYARSGLAGNDQLRGTANGDILSGGHGNDNLQSYGGDDYLIGGAGNDYLNGGDGLDDLFGGSGNDRLIGGKGEDYLLGGSGNDTLEGGSGNDVLTGGRGDDVLKGGLGDDIYIFNRGDGKDIIDESAYQQVNETYTYATGNQVRKTVGSGKSAKTVWVNEVRTGTRKVNKAVEGGEDTVQFGTGIDVSDLIINTVGADLVVQLDPGHEDAEVEDQITIKKWTTPEFRVETFRFANDFAVDVSAITFAKTGTDANNTISASGNNSSWLSGGKGNDRLNGSSKADILMGGEGNDTLVGGAGDDVYVFNRGDGKDRIIDSASSKVGTDQSNPGGDKLLFGAGITIEDLILQRSGNDLKVYVTNGQDMSTALDDIADVITIQNWANGNNRVEVFQFFDGMDFDLSNITNTYLGRDLVGAGTSAIVSDNLRGSNSSDWMDGFSGNDVLHAYRGDDFLFGRDGNDTAYGHDGDDVIAGGKGNDKLYGGNHDDILTGGEGDDLLNGDNGNDALIGGSGNDTLNGGAGNDVIVGDKGNDTYTASTGADVYRFGFGDGNDTYNGSTSGSIKGTDIFIFESDISKEDVWFERVGNDLLVRLLGAEDTITFKNWYYSNSASRYIDGFKAGDEYLNYRQIDKLVSAMKVLEANDGTTAYGVTSDDLPTNVANAIENAWDAA